MMKPLRSLNKLSNALQGLMLLGLSAPLTLQNILETQQQILCGQNDLLAMERLSELVPEYLPWTDSAMRPSGLIAVINDIILHSRNVCLECGSGISTVYIGSILSDKGGHLFSIEHDEDWANFMKGLIHSKALNNVVTIIHAPLKDIPIGLETYIWYDTSKIEEYVGVQKIDLLLVDGPPAYANETEHARFPALPFFLDKLAIDFTIFLDDADRIGEQHILDRWQNDYGIHFERRLETGRIAIAKSGSAFRV